MWPKWYNPLKQRKFFKGRDIVDICAATFDVDINDIYGSSKRSAITQARQCSFAMIRKYKNVHGKPFSYPQIGRIFKRDHSTVIYGIKKHDERMIDCEIYRSACQETERIIKDLM